MLAMGLVPNIQEVTLSVKALLDLLIHYSELDTWHWVGEPIYRYIDTLSVKALLDPLDHHSDPDTWTWGGELINR